MNLPPNRKTTPGIIVALTLTWLTMTATVALGEQLESAGTLFCTFLEGVECRPEGRNRPFNPESVGLPAKFVIDFSQEMILPDKDSVVRQRTRIRWKGRVENRLVLAGAGEGVEGVDDGVGWSISLDLGDGRFVTTASGSRVGYVAFGACRVEKR